MTLAARQKIPTYDYEIVKGDQLDILIQYAPNGAPMEWDTASVVEVSVRLPDNTEIEVPSDRIELIDSTELDADEPNILTYLTSSETESLPDNVPCPYQVRLVESADLKRTILTGMIIARFSAVDGV